MLEHASGPYPAIEVTPETPVFSGTYRSKSNGPTNTGAVEHRRVSSLVEEAPTSPDLSSDSFQTSSLSESEQIVHVYALLERLGGVFGDGLLEGVELTRDGRALSYQSSNTGKAQWNKRLHQARFGDAQTQHTISTLTQGPETDRYGFFTRQHSLRSSTSSNDARTWLLERVSYATDTATPGASAIPKRASLVSTRPPNREEVAKEIERTDKWLKMLRHSGSPGQEQVWSFSPKILSSSREQRKLRRRIYKGVPDRWRPAVWPLLASLTPAFQVMPSHVLNSAKDLGQGKRLSRANFNTASPNDTQIDLDIPRTLGTHSLFLTRYGKGQRMLFEVLHEQSRACTECGYCQGMATIAGVCIAYGSPAVFATLHGPSSSTDSADFPPFDQAGKFRHHDMLRTGFPALSVCFEQQDRLCKQWMPTVAAALETHGIHPSSYATKWYITLFTSSTFGFGMQLRIWDALLLEGRELLVVVSLAIIHGLRGVILCPRADFETILNALSGAFVVEDEDAFMTWVSRKLKQWRKSTGN